MQKCVNPQSKQEQGGQVCDPQSKQEQGGRVCVVRQQTPVLLYSWDSTPRGIWQAVMSVLWLYLFSSPLFPCRQALGLFFPRPGCLFLPLRPSLSMEGTLLLTLWLNSHYSLLHAFHPLPDEERRRRWKNPEGTEAKINSGSVWRVAQLFPS